MLGLSLSFRFNGHFPGEPELHYITYKFITRPSRQFASESGVLRWRQNDYTISQCLLKQRMTEVVVTTGLL